MRQTELRGYLPALRRWWPEVVASALIAGVAAALIAGALPKTYEARSQLLVGPVNATADGQRAAATLARTYAELIVSESFLDAAVNELQRSINQEITSLIARQGPVARDVRELLALYHAAAELERLGDRVTNIGEDVVFLVTGQIEDLNP